MIMLDEWARRWNVPVEAMRELRQLFNIEPEKISTASGVSELAVQTEVRLAASRKGIRLWRNNAGAAYDQTGRLVRYGLLNDSGRIAQQIKSSDLIGITPRIIQPTDVGLTMGVFTALEIKRSDWVYKDTPREKAQYAFIRLVNALGGFAKFVRSPREAGY